MTVVTTVGREKFGPQIRLFLACLYFQNQLETKILIKNGSILIFKSLLKERCTCKKAHGLKQSIFVYTKHKTECERPICLQYFLTPENLASELSS